MHRGAPAGTSARTPPPPPPEAQQQPRQDEEGWPVQSGAMPARADGFTARLETAPSLGAALLPGTAAALIPARHSRTGSPDWLGSCGKTQLAIGYAQSLLQSREIDLLTW